MPPLEYDPTAEPLVPVSQFAPEVPRSLCDDGSCSRGLVVRFTVDVDGRVSQARVVSGRNQRLNKLVVEAVSRWRYAPRNRPRETQVTLSLRDD